MLPLVPLLHMDYPQDEPYILDHAPFRSCLYHLESFNPKLSVECDKGKKHVPLMIWSSHQNDCVWTKSMGCWWWKISYVDHDSTLKNFRYISSLEMSIMSTNLLVFGTKHYMCSTFIFLCHLDTPYCIVLPGDLVNLTFDVPPWRIFNLEIFSR